MKTKIYLVTFTSYTESDNYLHNEQKTFTNPLFAQDYYEKMCNNATENANDIYEDEDGNLDELIVEGTESRQDANNRTCKIERETGTEFGYQAEIKLEAVEIDVPFATDRRKYGMTLKEIRDEIAAFTGDKKGEAMRKAKIFAHHISIAHVCRIRLSFGHRTDEHGNRTEDHNWLQIQWTDQDGDSDTFSIIE